MTENKVYTQDELEQQGILTNEYHLNLEPGEFFARLDLKAKTRRNNILRVFFTFEDGCKVMATTHWFNGYLGFYEADVGTAFRLTFTQTSRGEVYLTKAETVEKMSGIVLTSNELRGHNSLVRENPGTPCEVNGL